MSLLLKWLFINLKCQLTTSYLAPYTCTPIIYCFSGLMMVSRQCVVLNSVNTKISYLSLFAGNFHLPFKHTLVTVVFYKKLLYKETVSKYRLVANLPFMSSRTTRFSPHSVIYTSLIYRRSPQLNNQESTN